MFIVKKGERKDRILNKIDLWFFTISEGIVLVVILLFMCIAEFCCYLTKSAIKILFKIKEKYDSFHKKKK